MGVRVGRTLGRTPWLLVACGILLSGCANFDDPSAGETFTPTPQWTAPAGPEPSLPEIDGRSGTGSATPAPSQTPVPPPQGCTDYDKAVIATCLNTVSAIATLPGDGSGNLPGALAGERMSGRVMLVANGTKPTQLAALNVDPTGDGGLTGLALSPKYTEDQLVFAYITTATDNRVVRFARGQQPKPILTGIPRGATGNRGALATDGANALIVATGDAGNPAAAADPRSLAGKLLRIDTSGNASEGNPTPGSRVYASGLHAPGGICQSADLSRLWVTDRGTSTDVIYRVNAGAALGTAAWTWPDRPGVAGCADQGDSVMIAMSAAANIQQLPITPDGAVGGTPQITMDSKVNAGFGRYGGMDLIDSQYSFVGTVNRDGGQPVSSDDRVVIIQHKSGGASGKD
jgi:glucose/arabinose dehydrogenase